MVQVPETILKKYVGVYKKSDGTVRAITMNGGSMWYDSPEQELYGRMYFTSDSDYFTYLFPIENCIYMDNLGNVKGLKSKGAGGSIFAKKLDTLNLTVTQFNGLTWDALQNKDIKNALSYSQQGLKVDSTYLLLLGNYAHANLFMGNYVKAIEIYKKYLGQKPSPAQRWEEMIKSDFKTFKALGYPVEPMDKVLKELKL